MSKKKILQDHKQHGKILSPILMQYPWRTEVSWVKTMLPDLLWIALIQDSCGYEDVVKHVFTFTQICKTHAKIKNQHNFATISSFTRLTLEEQMRVMSDVSNYKEFSIVQKALSPVVSFYPQCPLRFLFAPEHFCKEPHLSLEALKSTVEKLYDRRTKFSSKVQAIAVFLALESGSLSVGQGNALLELNEIEKYPDTELSKQVAGAVRAAVNLKYGIPSSIWPEYFWNRGIEIDKCYLGDSSDE